MQKFTLNGETVEFDGEGDMPLLWYLRDLVGLTGTKYSCGIGQCGACTVHMNGQAVRSCQTTMGDIEANAYVTTIEGLDGEADKALKTAWAENDVPQCGYCQAGQIMQASALLKENANPTDDEVTEAMWGNLCRCGTYQRIKKAIRAASAVKAGDAS